MLTIAEYIFQVLNLFLALLLSNFGSSNLSAPTADSDTSKIVEAFDRIGRFINWIKSNILKGLKAIKAKVTNQISVPQIPGKVNICFCPRCKKICGTYF